MPTPARTLLLLLLAALFLAAPGRGLVPAAVAADRTAVDYARDLEAGDRDAKREAAYQLSRLGRGAKVALPQLVKALEDDQQQVWFGAITALANLGPDAEPALPALLRELEAWQPYRKDRQGAQALYRTALALGAIGPAAVPALSNSLASARWHVRAGAARALGFAGAASRPVIPALARLLADERAEVREAASETLGGLGPEAVPPVLALLRIGEETRTRLASAQTLWRLGTNAAPAVAALRQTVAEDHDPGVRAAALTALSHCGLGPRERVEILLSAWADPEEPVRTAAYGALLLVRPVETALLPALLSRLHSVDASQRQRVAKLIAELGPDARGAVGSLVELLRAQAGQGGPDPLLTRALAAIGPAALQAVAEELRRSKGVGDGLGTNQWAGAVLRQVTPTSLSWLGSALTNVSPAIRAGALEGAAALGEQARPLARQLPPLLEDSEPGVRARAWRAAGACGVPADVLLARFDGALRDGSREVRVGAVCGLGCLGAAAATGVPKLIELLAVPDEALRLASVRALGALGSAAVDAASPLADLLPAASAADRIEVLRALGRIGSARTNVLAQVTPLLTVDEAGVRRETLMALGALGSGARAARPGVDVALQDPDPSVRAAAVTARVAIDLEGDAVAETVARQLDDPDAAVRRAAAGALAKLEERGRPAEARLFALLDSAEDRVAATEALRAIHPTNLPALLRALRSADAGVRELAADSLARLGRDAGEAVAALETAQREDPSESVKRAARRAVRRIRGN